MRFFVTRARYNTDLAAAHAETNRVRTQRDNALAERDTAIFNRRQVLDQLADAQAGNRRMHGRLLELGHRLSQLTESDPEYLAALEHRVRRLLKVIDRIAGAGLTEHRRANHLQRRLDQALGLDSPVILAKARRQDRPAAKEDAS